MQSDVLYDLALRALSGEDGIRERLKDAESAQLMPTAEDELDDERGTARAGRELRFNEPAPRSVRPADA